MTKKIKRAVQEEVQEEETKKARKNEAGKLVNGNPMEHKLMMDVVNSIVWTDRGEKKKKGKKENNDNDDAIAIAEVLQEIEYNTTQQLNLKRGVINDLLAEIKGFKNRLELIQQVGGEEEFISACQRQLKSDRIIRIGMHTI